MPEIAYEEWLEKRRTMVTASELAALCGFDPYGRTPVDLFVQKKTGHQLEDTIAMRIGRKMEEPAVELYKEETGREVHDPGQWVMTIHPDLPRFGATLDRLTECPDAGWIPLEAKNCGAFKLREWTDGLPIGFQVQLNAQMACEGSPIGAYCGIIGGTDFRYGDIDRNDKFIESCLPLIDKFLWHLDNDITPPITAPSDLAAVKLLHPDDNGKTVALDDDALELANSLDEAKYKIKEIAALRDKTEARLRAALGDATFGALADGTILSLKTTSVKGYTKVMNPNKYRVLRRSK
jgi:predicted phage-related endonuclease